MSVEVGERRGFEHNVVYAEAFSALVGFHFVCPSGLAGPTLSVWVHLQWRI